MQNLTLSQPAAHQSADASPDIEQADFRAGNVSAGTFTDLRTDPIANLNRAREAVMASADDASGTHYLRLGAINVELAAMEAGRDPSAAREAYIFALAPLWAEMRQIERAPWSPVQVLS